jgi:hypothetical protein
MLSKAYLVTVSLYVKSKLLAGIGTPCPYLIIL